MVPDRIVVVGAGPVGLVAAAMLSKAEIPVVVVEESADLPDDLRASTFHPPTLDMLEPLGVVNSCISQGIICPYWQFRDRREGVIATFDLGLLADETRHPYRLQCEQWKLTRALRAQLHKQNSVEIRYAVKAVSFTQNEEGVTLVAEAPDGVREEIEARFLIGADGARSIIRQASGIAFEGMTIPELYLTLSTTFDFSSALPSLANIAYISDPDEWLVLLRTPSLWRVLFPTPADISDADLLAPQQIDRRLQNVARQQGNYTVVHKTAYRVHERVADHYVLGRVFLAGDAAHLNNPLGGMGMNGGIHDAVNLAEKLIKVWHGAPLDIMMRYERQRRKVAIETVQAQSLRNRHILNERDPAIRKAYHDELRRIVADLELHRAYLRRSSMLQSLAELDAVA